MESVKFPLDKDSKASFTQYIFENTDELLNIFNYKRSQKSVEITILNNDDIFSVNYHSLGKSRFTLVGKPYPKKNEREFPFLLKNEKHRLIEKKSKNIIVNKLPGFKFFHLGEKNTGLVSSESIILSEKDIVRMYKDDIQIFLRYSKSPPKIKTALLFSKDKDLKKVILIISVVMFIFSIIIGNVEVNKEVKEEKIPKIVATILRKPKLKKEPKIEKKPKPIKPKEVTKVKNAVKEVKKVEMKTEKVSKKKKVMPVLKPKKILKGGSVKSNKLKNKPKISSKTKVKVKKPNLKKLKILSPKQKKVREDSRSMIHHNLTLTQL